MSKKLIWIFGIIIIILICFIFPGIINFIYSFEDGIKVQWNAADYLIYFGTILSFLGTLFLGLIAIMQNQRLREDNKKNVKLSYMPYIGIEANHIEKRASGLEALLTNNNQCNNIDDEKNKGKIQYTEDLIKDLYFYIFKDTIDFDIKERKCLVENKNSLFKPIQNNNIISFSDLDGQYMSFVLTNIGNGTATDFSVRFIKEGFLGIDKFDTQNRSVIFKIGDVRHLGIYIDNKKTCQGKYKIIFSYNDILKNNYVQKYELIIDSDKTILECSKD